MNYPKVTLADLLAFAAIRRRSPDPARFHIVTARYLAETMDKHPANPRPEFARLAEYGWIEISGDRKPREARAVRITERGLRETEKWRKALFG